MRSHNILFVFSLSFLIGIAIRSLTQPSLFFVYIAVLASAVLSAIVWSKPKWRWCLLAPIFILLGILRFEHCEVNIDQRHIAFYNGQEITFQGMILHEPVLKMDKRQIIVETQNLVSLQKIHGAVLITTALYPEYHYADHLQITCNLKTPAKFPDFDYAQYLAKDDIFSVCYYPEIKILPQIEHLPLLTNIKLQILNAKAFFITRINQILPEPESSLLTGLILGGQSALFSEELKTAFNSTSTTHIIAVSGFNIAIIFSVLIKIAPYFYLSRKKAFYAFLPLVIIFIILTGGQASVIRASIFGLLAALAFSIGRLQNMRNALILSALIMTLFNPKILMFDLGFQLSFLAVIGLIYLGPIIEKNLNKLIKRLNKGLRQQKKNKEFKQKLSAYAKIPSSMLKESLFTTLSAIIFTAPLIVYTFHRFSLIGLLANILILWIIPICMLLGFVGALAGVIYLPLGKILALPAWLCLSYVIWIVQSLAKWQYASVEIRGLPWWGMIGFYVILAGLIFYFNQNKKVARIMHKNT